MPWLAIDRIVSDEEVNQRANDNEPLVMEYQQVFEAAMVEAKKPGFPAVDVFYDGDQYWLSDGFKRHAAAKLAKYNQLLVEVTQGTRDDAILAACRGGRNSQHGERWTRDDRMRSVKTLLCSDKWGGRSASWIAETAGVSLRLVQKAQKDLERSRVKAKAKTAVDRRGTHQPTEHTSEKTVAGIVVPNEVARKLSKVVKDQLESGELQATDGEVRALAELPKDKQRQISNAVTTQDEQTVAGAIEEESGEAVCHHPDWVTCGKCDERYCPVCEPDHAADCSLAVKPTREMHDDRRTALAAWMALIRAMERLNPHLVRNTEAELTQIKQAITTARPGNGG